MRGNRARSTIILSLTAATLLTISHGTNANAVSSSSSTNPTAIVAQFHDGSGLAVVLRQGEYNGAGKGWGWAKIVGKHGITNMNLVKMIIGLPGAGTADPQDPDRIVYRAVAERGVCSNGGCRATEIVNTVAVVDYGPAGWDSSHVFGVVTAYCDFGDPAKWLCPPWVNNIKVVM